MKLYSVVYQSGQINVRAEGSIAAIARTAKFFAARGGRLPPVTVVHDLTDLSAASYYPAADMPTIGHA